jgi:hypothetical protein
VSIELFIKLDRRLEMNVQANNVTIILSLSISTRYTDYRGFATSEMIDLAQPRIALS